MKIPILTVLSMSLVACASAAPERTTAVAVQTAVPYVRTVPPVLVGRWEATNRSSGGCCGVFDLFEDGTLVEGMALAYDARYSWKGDRVLIEIPESDTQEVTPTFDGDTMSEGEGRRLRRVGAATPGVSPLVGVWTCDPDDVMGMTYWYRYTADGRAEHRISMPLGVTGRWAVAGGTLRFTSQGETRVLAAEIDGDVLWLSSTTHGSHAYRRTERWYDFPETAAGIARMAKWEREHPDPPEAK